MWKNRSLSFSLNQCFSVSEILRSWISTLRILQLQSSSWKPRRACNSSTVSSFLDYNQQSVFCFIFIYCTGFLWLYTWRIETRRLSGYSWGINRLSAPVSDESNPAQGATDSYNKELEPDLKRILSPKTHHHQRGMNDSRDLYNSSREQLPHLGKTRNYVRAFSKTLQFFWKLLSFFLICIPVSDMPLFPSYAKYILPQN